MATIATMGMLDVPYYAELPMQGVANWVNPFNGVEILALHYTAHSAHRTLAWKHETMEGFTAQAWEQEMELNFQSYGGRPVYSDFDRSWHVARLPEGADPRNVSLTYFKGVEMWCGWDEGRQAAVIGQQCERRLYIYAARQSAGGFINKAGTPSQFQDQEYPVSGLGAFIQLVKEWREREFPGASWRDVGDPSIAFETKQHQGTSEMIFRDNGVKIEMAPTNKIIVRREAVDNWLNYAPGGKPGLLIDPSCTLVIEGMAGGYQFSKDGAGTDPVKDGFSHCQDCIQYLCLCVPHKPKGRSSPAREVQPRNVDAAQLRQEWKRIQRGREQENEVESWMDW